MIKLHVEIIEHSSYLEFVCSGDHVPEDWEELVDLQQEQSERTGKSRLLVNVQNLNFPMDNMTRYRMGLLVAEKFGPESRVAALTTPEHINYFWETVAHNRGASVKASTDRPSLVQWLCEEAE